MVSLLPRLPAPAAAALQGPLDALQGCAIDTGMTPGVGCVVELQHDVCVM